MCRECHDAEDRINNPAQQSFMGSVAWTPLLELFEGGDVLPKFWCLHQDRGSMLSKELEESNLPGVAQQVLLAADCRSCGLTLALLVAAIRIAQTCSPCILHT
jgi:hypothetical protein